MGLGLQHTPPLPLICQALSSSSWHCCLCLTSERFLLSGSKAHSPGIHPAMDGHPAMPGMDQSQGYADTKRTCKPSVVDCLQGFIPQVPSLNQAGRAKRSISGIPALPGNLLPTNRGTCLESLAG